MDFEDILAEVDDYGVYQKRLVYLFLVPTAILLPLLGMTTLFMVSAPDHWCRVSALNNLSQHLQRQIISPIVVNNGRQTFDSCHMFDTDYDYMVNNIANISLYLRNRNVSDLPIKACDNGWNYDDTNYDETAVSALNLVCDNDHYASIILSIGGVGTVIGTPIFSWLSDKIGRRKTFFLTVFVFLFSTLSPTIFKDFTSFIIFRIINGTIFPSIYQIPYVALIEIVGPQARTRINGIACITWVLGLSALPFLAYITRHWVILNIVTFFAGLIFFVYWKVLPESPRWLLINHRYDEAQQEFIKIARINKRPVPNELASKLKNVGKKMNSDDGDGQKNSFIIFATKPGIRKKFLLVTANWLANIVAYCGINYNIYNFHGNQFVNFFLLSIIELPSYFAAWYCVETRLGRRWSNVLFMCLCGVSLCIPAVVPTNWTNVINVVTLIGKFGVSASFMIVYQQGAEIYPTAIRNQGLGIGAMISSVLNIGLPYLALLGRYGLWVPLTTMGSVAIVTGLVSTLLPETLNENLPQTIEEGDAFGKDRKFFSWAKTIPSKPKKEDNEVNHQMLAIK